MIQKTDQIPIRPKSFMLSILLYGRNDNHGYNYHKRLAISLNAIAHTLTNPHDEILFTDYNSSDDLPTLLEAIEDTLSEKAKSLIRIFRVRPETHKKLSSSHLPLIEPIARNAALVRSNPLNKWILSTNPDMLFVPRNPDQSLSEIVEKLPNGFYGLPRFELPERFWELCLDRMDPQKNFAFLRSQTARLNLDTIVRMQPFLKYDAPGDFQLFLREDLFELNGFDEKMQRGFHVDSNLNKRASMVFQSGKSLEDQLLAFHCNHTQNPSLQDLKTATENSVEDFVHNPNLKPCANKKNWGIADLPIEEIRLPKNHSHVDSLLKLVPQIETVKKDFYLGNNPLNEFKYSSFRIFSFLTDHLIYLPKTAHIAYFGWNQKMIELIASYLKEMGFENPPLSSFEELSSTALLTPLKEIAKKSSVLIFDFGFDIESSAPQDKSRLKKVMNVFFDLLKQEQLISSQTKWIGINVELTDFNLIFKRHLYTHRSNFITGISFGCLPQKTKRKKRSKSFSLLKKDLFLRVKYRIIRHLFEHVEILRTWSKKTKISK